MKIIIGTPVHEAETDDIILELTTADIVVDADETDTEIEMKVRLV